MSQLANGEVWTYDMVNAEFWERYLNVFDKIVVCGRIEKVNDNNTTGLMKSSRDNVEFVAMPNFRGIGGLMKNYFILRKIIKKAISKVDCIIYRAPSPISLIAYPLVRKSKKPYALELATNPITLYSRESFDSIVQPIVQYYVTRQTRNMCKNANGVSYVTDYILQDMFPCTSLMKEVDGYFCSHYSTIKMLKSDYRYLVFDDNLPNPLVLVHSGKMNDNRKGQDILIKMVKILIDEGYNIQLKLIGDGVLRTNFERLARSLNISDNVLFLGWKTGYKEVQEILQSSHLFVFPSMGEGLPRSVIEAMANSLITIASAIDGINELLPEELLVYQNTSDAFAKKIKTIVNDWSKFNNLRTNIYQKSLEYENSLLTERRNEFYTKLRAVVLNRL